MGDIDDTVGDINDTMGDNDNTLLQETSGSHYSDNLMISFSRENITLLAEYYGDPLLFRVRRCVETGVRRSTLFFSMNHGNTAI